MPGFDVAKDFTSPAVNQFGYDSPDFQVIRIYLDTARDKEEMGLVGTLLWAVKASSITANVSVKFNAITNSDLSITEGISIAGYSFSRVFLTHTAQAGEWIDLLYTREVNQMRIENPGSTFTNVSFTKASTGTSPAWVTVTAAAASAIVSAAAATRRTVIITAPSTNTQTVNIGIGAASGAAAGQPLDPGESLMVDGTMAIYGYTGAGVDQTLAISTTAD